MQSWNLWMKSSTIGACEIWLLSMCLFETLSQHSPWSYAVPVCLTMFLQTLALVVLLWESTELTLHGQVPPQRYLHWHPATTISLKVLEENMVPACVTETASGFIWNWPRISQLFFLSSILPIPWNKWLCLVIRSSISWLPFSCLTVFALCPSLGTARSLGSAKQPSGWIFSIPNSVNVSLLVNGGECILPDTTTNLVDFPHVWLRITVWNSPLTSS